MEGVELRDFALEAADYAAAFKRDLAELKGRRREGGWLRQFWRSHIRITLHDVDSRDHLALERTFLAYVRTSTAYAQLGVTIAQLFRLNNSNPYTPGNTITATSLHVGKALGAVTEGIAMIILLLGAAYFFKQQTGLMNGTTIARGYEIVIMLLLTLMLLCIILVLLATAGIW